MQEISDNNLFLLISFAIGIIYGFIAQRKQFCFSGSIKDIILFKHSRRTASLIVAITTAILSTQVVGYFYDINLTNTKYFSNINYLFIVLGGAMFGYGMMISDGCSSRHLVKFGQGEKDSFFILTALGIFSYITYKLFATYGSEIYNFALVQTTMAKDIFAVPLYIVIPILLFFLYKSLVKCMNFFQVLDGVFIGLLIAFVWYFTSVVASDLFLSVTPQSLSFVYPLGKITDFILSGFNESVIIFSVVIVIGIIFGSFISSKLNKKYNKKQMCDNSQQNPPTLLKKLLGGAFMGIGGILAVGCTVGQGLSGVSTLSSASFVAIISIYISAYFTAKSLHKNNALIACFVFDFETRKCDK
jgi:uncharacterized membrane protein YedE/YeeE